MRCIYCLSIAASLSIIGCTIPAAPAYPNKPGDTNPGRAYCSLLAERAGQISTAESGAGWAILTTAVGGVAAGTLITRRAYKRWWWRHFDR